MSYVYAVAWSFVVYMLCGTAMLKLSLTSSQNTQGQGQGNDC